MADSIHSSGMCIGSNLKKFASNNVRLKNSDMVTSGSVIYLLQITYKVPGMYSSLVFLLL